MAEQNSVYAKGLYFNANHPNTPDSVKEWKKGSVSVHIQNFTDQLASLKDKADDKGYIRFDLTKNEKNEEVFYSFRLNDYKPTPKDSPSATPTYPETADNINPEDIPF